MHHVRRNLPAGLALLIGVAGVLAIFATYWDEAWHTDIGRDTFWAAPHLLLYGAIAVVGLSIAGWGIAQLVVARSLRAALRNRALLAAGMGALGALVAAPIDNLWHEAYGRDAVLWSPPHMLAVFGAIAMVLGVLAGLPENRPWFGVGAGVLLLANALTVVFEYETGVPQFSEIYYLPLLIVIALAVASAMDKIVATPRAVTVMVLGYVAIRLVVMAGLAALGRSVPDLPIAILGLILWDLPLASRPRKAAAAATGIAALELVAAWSGLVSQPLQAVSVIALPLFAAAAVVLSTRARQAGTALGVVLTAGSLALVPADPAAAHDPGQGEPFVSAELSATVNGRQITMSTVPSDHCDDLRPLRIVARRAGQTVTGPLRQRGECTFSGALTLPEDGRWFTYVEFEHDEETLEAWLPVIVGDSGHQASQRDLYLPAGGGVDVTAAQTGFGALIYLAGLILVALGWSAVRNSAPSYSRS